jgi:DNA-directed RNA polymerase subunit delta
MKPMGGHQVTDQNPGDDGYDEDGYDESQRAEILEVTRDGRSDGTILVDLDPDLGGEIDDGNDEDAVDALDEEDEDDDR